MAFGRKRKDTAQSQSTRLELIFVRASEAAGNNPWEFSEHGYKQAAQLARVIRETLDTSKIWIHYQVTSLSRPRHMAQLLARELGLNRPPSELIMLDLIRLSRPDLLRGSDFEAFLVDAHEKYGVRTHIVVASSPTLNGAFGLSDDRLFPQGTGRVAILELLPGALPIFLPTSSTLPT